MRQEQNMKQQPNNKSDNTTIHKCDNCRNKGLCQIESSTENYIKPKDFTDYKMVTIKMSHKAFRKAMDSISSRPAESGGIWLGPVGTNEITDFYFDRGANCSGSSYSPDYMTLNRKMKEEWLPAGIDMKGFVHSHPGRLDRLTRGDLTYIKRLLDKNSDMDMFIAPIIIPGEYRMRPLIVTRQDPYQPRDANITFF